jgi:hypothetical protein
MAIRSSSERSRLIEADFAGSSFHCSSLASPAFPHLIQLLVGIQLTKYIQQLPLVLPHASASRPFSSSLAPSPSLLPWRRTVSPPIREVATALLRRVPPRWLSSATTEQRVRTPPVAAGAASPPRCLLPPIRVVWTKPLPPLAGPPHSASLSARRPSWLRACQRHLSLPLSPCGGTRLSPCVGRAWCAAGLQRCRGCHEAVSSAPVFPLVL